MFSCLRRSEADQPSDVELPLLSDDPCIFCKTIIDHGNNVKKVVEKAKNQLKGKFVKKKMKIGNKSMNFFCRSKMETR